MKAWQALAAGGGAVGIGLLYARHVRAWPFRPPEVPPAPALPLTVEEWRTNPATGTATQPEKINDNLFDDVAWFRAVGEYCEIQLPRVAVVNKLRTYGGVPEHNGDGQYKVQYWDGSTWRDAVVGIPTSREEGYWHDWVSFPPVTTNKIRIVATAIDTGGVGNNEIEWEMRGVRYVPIGVSAAPIEIKIKK